MIDELPVHPNAVGALDSSDGLTFDTLAAALAGRESWVLLPEFLDRLRENGVERRVPVARESLVSAARREAERRGDYAVRCEYLLLGALRPAASGRALDRARTAAGDPRRRRRRPHQPARRPYQPPGRQRGTGMTATRPGNLASLQKAAAARTAATAARAEAAP